MANGKFLSEREQSLVNLAQTYERLGKTASLEDKTVKERSINDPFGYQEDDSNPEDRWHKAKEVNVRVVKAFKVISEQWGLGPEEMIFAAELAALNILNAKDIPLPAKKIADARDAAFKYYEQSLPSVPDPKR
jgi:hypothetical protein